MIAKIAEIFESIQGEGLYQGKRQIFVRFFGCGLNCRFCDTAPASFKEFSASALAVEVSGFEGRFHSVSLTGGEPLEQTPFLKELLKHLKPLGHNIFLETNGILYEELRGMIDDIDIVSMDFKLPSSTGCRPVWQEHSRFLEIARKKNAYVKAVICRDTEGQDLNKAVDIIAEIDRDIPLVLQENFYEAGLEDKISRYREIAASRLSNVTSGIQAHKLLGVR
ncbi:MAG: 7-carboxy-7-deazaguanine synthase QueE [Candidatus Omnitrophica bacterium]|nr:7-carboxy-7-deazaguanine synthase QueE [Candidatus Omnitrophota bacterium]